MAGQSGCESCHGPGSQHVAAGGRTRQVHREPILEQSCLRCHGPERPKSNFRLTDRIEDNLRAEWTELNTRRTDASAVAAGASGPDLVSVLREGQDQFQIANTIRLEKQLTDWWFLSGGYLYSWVDTDASFQLSSQDVNGQPGPGGAWVSNEILLNQAMHGCNFNSQFRPLSPPDSNTVTSATANRRAVTSTITRRTWCWPSWQ